MSQKTPKIPLAEVTRHSVKQRKKINRSTEKPGDNIETGVVNDSLSETNIIAAREQVVKPKTGDVWAKLEKLAGTYNGPEDWSVEHDHYLYGTPRKGEKEEVDN